MSQGDSFGEERLEGEQTLTEMKPLVQPGSAQGQEMVLGPSLCY